MHKKLSMQVAGLALLTMLGACANRDQASPVGTPTASGKPAVCLSLERHAPNRGKPGGATTEDIAALLDRDNPVGRVRNLVGDTAPTIRALDKNNAAIDSLCNNGESNGTPGR